MFKTLNISSKLVLSVAISVIIAIVILISIVSSQVTSYAEKGAKDTIFISSKRYANYIEGILNESVVLTKGMSTSVNEMFSKHDQVSTDLIESLLKNTFDSSGYAAYTFLYLKDPSVLSDTYAIDKKYRSQDGNTFAMIFFDETTGKAGGIKTIQTPNDFSQLHIIQDIEKNSRYGDKDALFVSSPTRLNYDGEEFLGVNFGVPIFSNKGKFIGVMGYTVDLLEISQDLIDPKLDFLKGN